MCLSTFIFYSTKVKWTLASRRIQPKIQSKSGTPIHYWNFLYIAFPFSTHTQMTLITFEWTIMQCRRIVVSFLYPLPAHACQTWSPSVLPRWTCQCIRGRVSRLPRPVDCPGRRCPVHGWGPAWPCSRILFANVLKIFDSFYMFGLLVQKQDYVRKARCLLINPYYERVWK